VDSELRKCQSSCHKLISGHLIAKFKGRRIAFTTTGFLMRGGNKTWFLLTFLGFSSTGYAQEELWGKILKKGSTEILIAVNISNLNRRKMNVSDMGGNYRIVAAPGDALTFSSAGYLPDTLIVSREMLAQAFVVYLTPHLIALPSVRVGELSNYQIDSLQRRKDYANVLDKKHPVKLWNEKRPGDEPGLNFSPLGFFSKTEKQKRRLKKRLAQEEIDYYIDSKFSLVRVSRLTRLTGDSLRLFMMRYRPSYKFCRMANNQDMLIYINDKLVLFRKGNKQVSSLPGG
jgi:hypothetical protein